MQKLRNTSRLEIADTDTSNAAFGETLGFDVPTRYSEEVHALADLVLAVDSLTSPILFGLSGNTVWACRLLAGLLIMTRSRNFELPLRQRLEIETGVGLLVLLVALQGTITHRFWDRLYLFISGVIMLGNSLMTEVKPEIL